MKKKLPGKNDPSKETLKFGPYRDKPLDQVSLKYLDKLLGEDWVWDSTKEVIRRYLSDPAIQRELERELGGENDDE